MSQCGTPSKPRGARPARRLACFLAASALVLAGSVAPAAAQDRSPSKGLPIIRDAEIEQLLRDYITPVLKAAGLAKQNVQVVIVNDRAFNAFVVDGRRIFMNAGALLDSETPNQVIGVLAHEAGHISGGHLAKLHQQLANAQTSAILAMLLGAGAMAAAASTGSESAGHIGMAALSAPQEVIRRSLLAYQRAQEEQADRAGVRFLTESGQSARGMHQTFARLADQTLFATRFADPYLQSHPMPRERVAALEELAKTSPAWDKADSAELQLRHDLMRAKLAGFLERPDSLARRYPESDTSLPGRYARAIGAYRFSDLRAATAKIDALIQAQPGNAYFHELKGQALLENGRPAEAAAALRRAIALAPNADLMRIMLAQALIATEDSKRGEEAIGLLRAALAREPDSPDGYRQLAIAYGRKGDLAQADLASAQAAAASGDINTARGLAARAKTRFPVGSPGWVRADDIVSHKPPPTPRR